MNPKCVSMGELYGETDPNTFEWTDGLIAAATRRFAKQVPSTSSTPGEDSRAATTSVGASSAVSCDELCLKYPLENRKYSKVWECRLETS